MFYFYILEALAPTLPGWGDALPGLPILRDSGKALCRSHKPVSMLFKPHPLPCSQLGRQYFLLNIQHQDQTRDCPSAHSSLKLLHHKSNPCSPSRPSPGKLNESSVRPLSLPSGLGLNSGASHGSVWHVIHFWL